MAEVPAEEMQVRPTGRRTTVVVEFELAGCPDLKVMALAHGSLVPCKGKATYVDGRLAYVQISGPLRRTDGTVSAGRPCENNYTHRELMRAAVGSLDLPAWLADIPRALENQGAAV